MKSFSQRINIINVSESETPKLRQALRHLDYSSDDLSVQTFWCADGVFTFNIFVYDEKILHDRKFKELLLEYLV